MLFVVGRCCCPARPFFCPSVCPFWPLAGGVQCPLFLPLCFPALPSPGSLGRLTPRLGRWSRSVARARCPCPRRPWFGRSSRLPPAMPRPGCRWAAVWGPMRWSWLRWCLGAGRRVARCSPPLARVGLGPARCRPLVAWLLRLLLALLSRGGLVVGRPCPCPLAWRAAPPPAFARLAAWSCSPLAPARWAPRPSPSRLACPCSLSRPRRPPALAGSLACFVVWVVGCGRRLLLPARWPLPSPSWRSFRPIQPVRGQRVTAAPSLRNQGEINVHHH